jgi:hypothetical protein
MMLSGFLHGKENDQSGSAAGANDPRITPDAINHGRWDSVPPAVETALGHNKSGAAARPSCPGSVRLSSVPRFRDATQRAEWRVEGGRRSR